MLNKSLKEHRKRSEREYLTAALTKAKGNMRQAADIAGVHRGHLYLLCREHQIFQTRFRERK